MKTSKTAFALTLLVAVIFSFETKGQVSIGADLAPQDGVLPELKTKLPDADNATTGNPGEGLGLPRVKLTNPATLAPFLTTTDAAEEKNAQG
jgi:hypothetical protein